MRILYLYAELMGYQIPVFIELVNKYGAKLHIIHWDKQNLTPYMPPQIKDVQYYKRSTFSTEKLHKFCHDLAPDLVYISGWMDKGYLSIAKSLKNKGVKIVAGSDTQWKGTLKQILGSLIFPYTLKKHFNFIWIAGSPQYEYARRLGFKKHEIIFNTLSADIALFKNGLEFLKEKAVNYPKNFLYVGNFRNIKGTDILIKAYEIYRNKYGGDWGLICVGNGEMSNLLDNKIGIEKKEFASQESLLNISKRAGIFILPSRFDQWGLVVQEFAAAGLPLLLSENVGSSSMFLIKNYNGLIYRNNSIDDLAKAMNTFTNKSRLELVEMGLNSSKLAQRITPEIVAASLVSVFKN